MIGDIYRELEHLVVCCKNVEFGLFLIPGIGICRFKRKLLTVVGIMSVLISYSNHFLDFALGYVQNTESWSVGLNTNNIIVVSLRLEQGKDSLTEITADIF
jgi:hypothetical protein